MSPLRRFLTALMFAAVIFAGASSAQEPYRNTPRIVYVVGQPGWGELPPGDGGAKNLTIFATMDEAVAQGGGRPIYRIRRHDLLETANGTAWLDRLQANPREFLRTEIPWTDQAELEKIVQRSRTGSDLGPKNPNWVTEGRYPVVKAMKDEYLPGQLNDDYAAGVFYLPTEGPGAAFVNDFRVKFERGADGEVRVLFNNGTPVDTRALEKDVKGHCLWVMDAAGNFYVTALEWAPIGPMGYRMVNHSTIPSGHPVAAAGQIAIHDGKIVAIDNNSGHYQPSNKMLVQAVDALQGHGVAKGSYRVGWSVFAKDHPGMAYIDLDPEGRTKNLDPPPPENVETRPQVADPQRPAPDDSRILEPEENIAKPELDVDRRSREQGVQQKTPEKAPQVPPPDPAVVAEITKRITDVKVEQIDVKFMRDLYTLDPQAASVVRQILAGSEHSDKNMKMGEVRRQMDLMVWKEVLRDKPFPVERTNQGKSNGAKSDLDYTLYYLAEEAGLSIEALIKQHGDAWASLHQGLRPEQLEIKVMNGDEFYPDWRNEALSEFDHQSKVKDLMSRLRADKEKYSVPGAFKEQVQNRALREGWTEVLRYDPALDKPDVPIDQQMIRDQGYTREIAERYKGVHPQYNRMNSLGNLVQNTGEYLKHTGEADAARRAKYLGRVINEGLGRLETYQVNSYQQILESNLPDDQKQARLRSYLKKSFGLLMDDNGRPLLDEVAIEKFKKVIDLSMRIQREAATNQAAYNDPAVRSEYFREYLAKAQANMTELHGTANNLPDFPQLVLAEQERLFELDQKRVLAEATLAGLRHSVGRDLTPEGVLRNRVRFDPNTQKFVLDPEGAGKVAFERAVEVALFYELVNSIEDPFLRHDLKKRALASAPNQEMAEFYGALDEVGRAEIDRFLKGDPGGKVERTIEEMVRKQKQRAIELAIEKKDKVTARLKAMGIAVDAGTVTQEQVRDHIVQNRLWTLSPHQRAEFRAAFQEMSTRLKGDFKEAFYDNASGLMLGSSAVNLVRAYQMGGAEGVARMAFTEAINYMPDYIQTPLAVLDILARVKEGNYGQAAWSTSLFAAMAWFPALGHGMLAYNIIDGSLSIAHTHFVTRIDKDLSEQALKSRPRNEDGGPIANGALGPARARANRWPDARESVYNGSPPGYPLFFGPYRNDHARVPAAVVNGVSYSNGTVPQDDLADRALADTAAIEFGPTIDSILTAERLQPGSDAYRTRAWQLKLKFGFDIPFYRRIAKVYEEKYQYVTFHETWPADRGPNPEYLSECRQDVFDWYVRQPDGYKAELRGEGSGLGWLLSFLRDQTDKMQEMIAVECAYTLGRHHQAVVKAKELDQANRAAFQATMQKAAQAERNLVAAKRAVQTRIKSGEEAAARAVEQKALERAEKHQTWFTVNYPFTFATEELPPSLEFDVRAIPTKLKGTPRLTVDEEVTTISEGAPGGWKPGKDWEARFKPNAEGFIELRPITVNMRYTAHLLNQDSSEVAQTTLELPVVLYEPTVSGTIAVTVYAMGEKGDSSLYSGARVTLGKDTKTTGYDPHAVYFGRLAPGAYSVAVEPSPGDSSHGPGTGSATIEDALLSKSPKASETAGIVVKLPFIPKKIADQKDDKKDGHQGPGGGAGGEKKDDKKPGGGTGGEQKPDTAGAKGGGPGGPGGPGSVTTAEEAINKLAPLTSAAEKARDDAKNSCKYIEAAAAQQQLVDAAKNFVATTFPNGAPGEIQNLVSTYEAELAVLKKAATAQEAANVFLREGLAAVRAKRGEPALAALEKAANTPDIPACLHEQVMKLYNEIKTDIERRMLIIDKAVDAANNQCDFATAQTLGEQVEAEDKTLSWVVNELSKIKDLNRRQKAAKDLYNRAYVKANEAKAYNGDQAKAMYDEAIALFNQAMATAPDCEKKNFSELADLPARKAAVDAPKVDQSLILLLDTSGSMADNNKMENAKSAAVKAVTSVSPTTEVALITYDGGCDGFRVNQDFTLKKQLVIDAIGTLRPGGGTPTAPAIGFAHGYMQKNARSKSAQIILMTDGQNNCGSMTDAGAGLRNGTIPVRMDAVGFGVSAGDKAQTDLAEMVKASGNGNSYNAGNASELIAAFRVAFMTNQVKPSDPFVSGAAGTRLATLFSAAIAALKANDIRGAMGQFKSAVDQFPASPAANFNASLAYEAGGQPLQAMNYAKQYLNLAPNAFDAGQVRDRITMLEAEQAANPRAIYSPNDCNAMYRWAQQEVRQAGNDAVRKAKVYDIMTTAQRGDCAAAQTALDKYAQTYGRRP